MSDTPETDSYIGNGGDEYMTEGEIAMCDFARKLKRERDKLRAEKAELVAALERFVSEVPAMGDVGIISVKEQARATLAKAKEDA